MRYETLPNNCPDLLEERDKAVRNLGFVSLHRDSIMRQHAEACAAGSLSDDLRESADVVGLDYQNAIRWLLAANTKIREAHNG